MVEIEFDFIIKAELNDKIGNVLQKIQKNLNEKYFSINNKKINKNDIIKDIMNEADKKIKILINDFDTDTDDNNNLMNNKVKLIDNEKGFEDEEIKSNKNDMEQNKAGKNKINMKVEHINSIQLKDIWENKNFFEQRSLKNNKGVGGHKKNIKKKNKIISKGNWNNIKNKYILKRIFDNLSTRKSLNIIKYNKKIQEKLQINLY